MDTQTVIATGFLSIPVILFLIQFFKRVIPELSGRVWLVTALILGIAGQVLSDIAARGAPATLQEWLTLIGAGLLAGMTTSKAYDETLGK